MDWHAPPSGAGATWAEPGTPVVLRLLPFVHHPPARVVVLGDATVGRALDARGYRVVSLAEATEAPCDLVCEAGGFGAVAASQRAAHLARLADLLRPGGILFGAFPGGAVGELISGVSDRFDVARLEPSAFAGDDGRDWLEAVFVRR